MLSKVDLPQPDGPMIATNSPSAMSRSIASSASRLDRVGAVDSCERPLIVSMAGPFYSSEKVEPVLVGEAGVGGGDDALARLEPVEHFDEFGVAAAET